MKRSGFFLAVMSILFLASGFPSPAQAEDDRLNPDTAKYQSYDAYVSLYTKDPNSDQEAYAFNMAFSMLNGIPLNAKWEAKGQKEYLMNLANKKPQHYKVPNAEQLAIATDALNGQSTTSSSSPSPSTSGQGANSGCYIAKNGDYICDHYSAGATPVAAAGSLTDDEKVFSSENVYGGNIGNYNGYLSSYTQNPNSSDPEWQKAYAFNMAFSMLNGMPLDWKQSAIAAKSYNLTIAKNKPLHYKVPNAAQIAIAADILKQGAPAHISGN